MRRRLLAGIGALAAVAATVVAAVPAQALVTFDEGHVDVLDVDWTGGGLTLDLRGPDGVEYDPADVELVVKSAARTTVPSGSQWAFLGGPGASVWILPQSEPDATARDVLWAGWNATGVPSGVLTGNTMTMELVSVTGPNGLSLFTVGFGGTVNRLFDSEEAGSQFKTESLRVGAHAHANWAFEAAGTYTVKFKVTANGGAISTGERTHEFVVQP